MKVVYTIYYVKVGGIVSCKAPAKRSQHVNTTYRNIVGRNMLRAFGHRVTMCCNKLGVVGSSLKLVKFEPTTPNMSQHGGQTHATCCAQQCCVDMLLSFGRGLRFDILLRLSDCENFSALSRNYCSPWTWYKMCFAIYERIPSIHYFKINSKRI